MAVEIRQIDGRKELKKFVEFNLELYKNNPYHVPGIIKDERDLLDKDKNPSFDVCEAAYFLAYKDGKIVGRIAGIINHKANETWNQNYARFGFVDFINDDEVVDKLFETVEQWGRNKGMDYMHGPMSFTDMDQEAMLVEGFDQMGTTVGLYNYAYYPKQLERLGYVKSTDWKEYLIKIPKEIPEKHLRIANLVKEKYGLKVVKYKSRKEIMSHAEEIFTTLNKAYAPLYGFSELSPAQMEYYANAYLPLLRLDFFTAIVRERDEQMIAFAITMPNLSKAMRAAKGRLYPFGFIPLLNALKTPPKVVDLYLIGVLPEYQNKGINALIFADLIPIYNKLGVETAESNPELETNMAVQLQWSYFERKHHKTRRVFIKEL